MRTTNLVKVTKYLALSTTVVWASFVFAAKPNLQKITSDEKAKEVKSSIPSRLPNTVNAHSLGIGVGQTFLRGDFTDHGDDQITFDLYYNYSASYSFDMIANAHYSEHKFKETKVELSGVAVGIKSKMYQFDAFSPFVLGGLGFYQPRVTREVADGEMATSRSKVTFGIHFGAGAELRLNNRFTMGVLGHYHDPFDVKQEVGPEVEGSYFKLLLTGFYTF